MNIEPGMLCEVVIPAELNSASRPNDYLVCHVCGARLLHFGELHGLLCVAISRFVIGIDDDQGHLDAAIWDVEFDEEPACCHPGRPWRIPELVLRPLPPPGVAVPCRRRDEIAV